VQPSRSRIELACDLMEGFARRTGLSGGAARRYLWTDAFAVCNFLGLARATGEARWSDLARTLVEDVHRVLGRHRVDDARCGWISGLGEEEGARRPTAGGLRIGKPLPERPPGEPPDDRLEWERDGQYLHYLTKWMHALDQMARATGDATYERQAHELARRAHDAFAWQPGPGTRRRLYWKCSIDLSRPQVASMGQHDALDGLVTCVQLDAGTAGVAPDLQDAARDYASMLPGTSLATADPLGLGGLLVDAYRVHQLGRRGTLAGAQDLVRLLLASAAVGLRSYADGGELRLPAERRLAFRELGLAIGLDAAARIAADPLPSVEPLGDALARVTAFLPLRDDVEGFWSEPRRRTSDTWREHQDIDDVMLATALLPDGFLELGRAREAAASAGG
jgi:hypothetical protein